MTTEEHPTMEPVIWFEGTLIRDPQPHGGQYDWLLETLADADGDAPKITIRARGAEHSANIRDNAHKGSAGSCPRSWQTAGHSASTPRRAA